MVKPAFSVCIYCGSRSGDTPVFTAVATEVGQWIGQHGGQLVYGGSKGGLMGTLAHATQQAGGRVVGIIPRALVDRERANPQCDELHIVQTMHERKAMMADRSDFFVALPGGAGTLEELFETWTWRQLGYHHKPVGLLNTSGYFDDLLAFMRHSVQAGFMATWQTDLLQIDTQAQVLLDALLAQHLTTPKNGDAPLSSLI